MVDLDTDSLKPIATSLDEALSRSQNIEPYAPVLEQRIRQEAADQKSSPPTLTNSSDVLIPLDQALYTDLNPPMEPLAPAASATSTPFDPTQTVEVRIPSGSQFQWTPEFEESIANDLEGWILTGRQTP